MSSRFKRDSFGNPHSPFDNKAPLGIQSKFSTISKPEQKKSNWTPDVIIDYTETNSKIHNSFSVWNLLLISLNIEFEN